MRAVIAKGEVLALSMKNISSVGIACVGCFSCRCICPQEAISCEGDEEGFLYPQIDNGKCVDCGLCSAVCPALTDHDEKTNRIKAYYGKNKNTDIVKKSSSGGAFSAFADHILNVQGIVFGAVFDYNTKQVVYSDTDHYDINALRKSKYVASETGAVFSNVKNELEKGRKVLFCGLPCHVDGLRLFVGKSKNLDNLITVDFICGGTASPAFFKSYLHYLEKKNHSYVKNVDFRAKLYGWKEHSIKIEFENGKSYRNYAMSDPFFKGYFEKTYQRDSCYHCKFRLKHFSDITIADYWMGLQRGLDDDEGLSMIIINSKKGAEFFDCVLIEENNTFSEIPIEYTNYAFKTEAERYDNAFIKKGDFFKSVQKVGFLRSAKIFYLPHPKTDNIIRSINRIKLHLLRG